MTAIIDFPLRWERDNINRELSRILDGGEPCRPPKQEAFPLEQSHREHPEQWHALVVGEHDDKIVELAKLRQKSVPDVTVSLPLEAPLAIFREGEACITSDYTGTAEAAVLSVAGIWLIRGGRHYRSFRCCGLDGTGKLIKEWNVVEEAVEIDAHGRPLWKPIHRFISDLTSPELRLQEIDAQLRGLGIPRHL